LSALLESTPLCHSKYLLVGMGFKPKRLKLHKYVVKKIHISLQNGEKRGKRKLRIYVACHPTMFQGTYLLIEGAAEEVAG